MSRLVLAADVGGTKTVLAVVEKWFDTPGRVVMQRRYENREFADGAAVVSRFLEDPEVAPIRGDVKAACFAVAGPVSGERVKLTNLGWEFDSVALAARLGLNRVVLVNDFVAVGLGVEEVAPADLIALQDGKPEPRAPRAVVGAGTGLGVAWCHWDHYLEGWYVQPTEAGHTEFGPRNAQQDGLLASLRARHGHVSWERVVSGPGLAGIFEYLRERGEASGLGSVAGEEGPARVCEAALAGADAAAGKALEMFLDCYGAFAGNLALAGLTRGGIYIAGGIAPRIVSRLRDGAFMQAFRDKGRFAAIMADIPVHVVASPDVALLGAAAAA